MMSVTKSFAPCARSRLQIGGTVLVTGWMGHAGFYPLSESLLWQTFTSPVLKSANTTLGLLGYLWR